MNNMCSKSIKCYKEQQFYHFITFTVIVHNNDFLIKMFNKNSSSNWLFNMQNDKHELGNALKWNCNLKSA